MAFMKNMMASVKSKAENGVIEIAGAGAPTSGTSGTGLGICGPGSTYTDVTNKQRYRNIGTAASPYWEHVDAEMVKHLRTRLTIAQINAGATLLSAISGFQYRIVDMAMISIGGAAAAATTIDILATQSSSSVKLMAAAVAGLTQNTLLRAGATNGTILAGGVSFVENDANTAITAGKTGSDVTTATHVDFLLSYVLVKA